MLRRKRLIDPEKAAEERRAAREAAEQARREREKVQAATDGIMGEVQEHRRLLKENNFARRIRHALGGAEG
jgi:hypothetical protein